MYGASFPGANRETLEIPTHAGERRESVMVKSTRAFVVLAWVVAIPAGA
jgi:hypothetical protein